MNIFLLILAFAVLATTAGALALTPTLVSRRKLRRRMATLHGQTAASASPANVAGSLVSAVTAFGRGVVGSGFLPARTVAELRQNLAGTSLEGSNGLWLFIGAKAALVIALPTLCWALGRFVPGPPLMRIGIAATIGLIAPDMVLRRQRAAYQFRLEKSVPDMLDLLVICAQAGIGLEAAIWRVSEELRTTQKEIARELETTATELQITGDMRAALTGLGRRTGLESLRRVMSVLAQTLQYGTPLTEALRSLSTEMRQDALTKFEERAARLPVMLTVPMIVLILPAFFLIVGGPAAIRIGQALGH